jgi:hypothetical protein
MRSTAEEMIAEVETQARRSPEVSAEQLAGLARAQIARAA